MKAEKSKHTLSSFDEALAGLRTQVLTMAELTVRNVRNAERGLFERNNTSCATAIADDAEIDQLEIDVDRAGVSILFHFHPVASDLRRINSAMKVSSNLERVGDEAVTIARRARKLNMEPGLSDVVLLRPIFDKACRLLDDSLRAYREQDADLARGLRERDPEVNAAEAAFDNEIVGRIPDAPDQVESYMDLTRIARCLERIGDHAVNIGEDTIYAAEAEDTRHPGGLWKVRFFFRLRFGPVSTGEIQFTHERRFLGLAFSHPWENIAEETHRVGYVRTFIQHHTLGTA